MIPTLSRRSLRDRRPFCYTTSTMAQTEITLLNSLTRTKEPFSPLSPKEVTLYACGPTVYDHIHIGNLRAYLLPDLIHRLFTHLGHDVKLTINFTDFGHLTDDADAGEDKIMRGMKRAGLPITIEAMRDFVVPYIDSFKADNEAFGNLPTTNYTRASDYIKEQIDLIKTLEEKGYTYETSDGLYFDIAQFPEYGKLGNIDLEHMKAGARVEVNPEKKHPADFALWKKGDLGWESDWGLGFPGWHIECAAMAFATLGEQIDIHTGGEDLAYTHHNGEIAEAEAVTGKSFSQFWLHNAFITIGDEKIAKSTGNGIWLTDLLEAGFSPLDYRYWMLQSHYRTTANFTWDALRASQTARRRLLRVFFEDLKEVSAGEPDTDTIEKFIAALANDLDTPAALAIVWEVTKSNLAPATKKTTLLEMDTLLNLGLQTDGAAAELGHITLDELPEDIQELVQQRETARLVQNWDEADHLREALKVKGYEVEDSKDGVKITKS